METSIAQDCHIQDIVKVHKSAFPNFFLTELGDNFLRLYYRSVLKSDLGLLFVCIDNGKLIGFCAACTKSAGFNSSLIKRNALKFFIEGVKILLSRPKKLIRLVKNLSKQGNIDDIGDYAELMSIGVSQDIQNKGVGKQLLGKLENALQNKSVERLSLTTDAQDNEKTLGFYTKCGFSRWYEFITYPNRKMYRLIKQL